MFLSVLLKNFEVVRREQLVTILSSVRACILGWICGKAL